MVDGVHAQAPVQPAGHRWLGPVLLITLAAMISQGFVRFTFGLVIEPMREEMLGDYTTAGFFGAANLAAYVVGVLAVMLGGHRLPSATLTKVGLVGCTAGLLVVALAPNLPLLFVGIMLAGAMSAAVWLPVASIIAEIAPVESRGLAYGLMTMGVGATIVISGALVSAVRSVSGPQEWRAVWAAEAGLAAVVTVTVVLFLHSRSRTRATPMSGLTAYGRHVARRLSLVYLLYGLGFAVYIHYLIVCLEQIGGMTPETATRTYSFLGVASVVGSVLVARASDLMGRTLMLGLAISTTGVCSLAAVVVTQDLLLTLSVVLFGLVMTGVGGVVSAYVSDQVSPAEMPVVFGAATLMLGAAQVVSPPFGGWLADMTGSFHATYVVALGTGLASGILAWRLPRHPPRTLDS